MTANRQPRPRLPDVLGHWTFALPPIAIGFRSALHTRPYTMPFSSTTLRVPALGGQEALGRATRPTHRSSHGHRTSHPSHRRQTSNRHRRPRLRGETRRRCPARAGCAQRGDAPPGQAPVPPATLTNDGLRSGEPSSGAPEARAGSARSNAATAGTAAASTRPKEPGSGPDTAFSPTTWRRSAPSQPDPHHRPPRRATTDDPQYAVVTPGESFQVELAYWPSSTFSSPGRVPEGGESTTSSRTRQTHR